MNTKNFFKAVACAMLMPAVLLTTSCSKGDDAVTNPEKPATTETAINKGYALPVTVNVTRQDDAATRASFDGSKLNFSTGDKLFVYGWQTSIGSGSAAGKFAGTLDYVSEGTFSGTIYTHNQYEGTLDDLLDDANAILLPAGYEDYGYLSISDNNTTEEKYDDRIVKTALHSFAASKKLAVEQLSFEEKGSYTSGTGFTLNPTNAILNFTVTGLAASTNVTATLTDGNELTIQGDVTTDAEGNATFAMGVSHGNDLSELSLTVAGNPVTITSSSKELTAGKIYNITRSAGGTVNLSTIYTNYTASNGEILTGTLASNVKISIADGAMVTLNNVTINGVYDGDNYKWAGISCEGDATIILSGTNTVKGFHISYPGIHVPTGKTLTIKGTGSLNASSNGNGSGIGGGYTNPCGNIVIEDGTITATGEFRCAGIGGGTNACGNITISGGTITAQGGECGAGIGSGQSCECGYINITGGTVTATGGRYGAGIGSGYDNSSCGNITITSGVTRVTATKGMDAPCSIGKGKDGYTPSTCGTVTIGGNVGAITTSPYTYQP